MRSPGQLDRECDGLALIEHRPQHLVGVVPHVLHVEEGHGVFHVIEVVDVVELQMEELHRVLQMIANGFRHLG